MNSLHEYQRRAVQWVVERESSGLILDMGLGKTVSTLTAIWELMYDSFQVSRVLVVAPKKVAEETWEQEIMKWPHLEGLTVSKILGTEKQRRAALAVDADIHVINRENVVWLVQNCKWRWDGLVIDELSSFKDSSSKRFKALKAVRKHVSVVVGLTGTPGQLIDLWPQIYLLDEGKRLGRTKAAFHEKFFRPGRRNGHIVYEWVPKEGAQDEINGLLSDLCMSMSAKDYLTLPDRLDRVLSVSLPPKAREAYTAMNDDLVFDEVLAPTQAVKANKLLQITSGNVYGDDREIVHLHDEKLLALEQIVEEAQSEPVLVFYSYKHELDAIQKRLPQAKMLEPKLWNEGKQVLALAHPASCGHGLNLQHGGRYLVWYSLPWSLELYQQGVTRLHRQGQTKPVVIFHILARQSIDERVYRVLAKKANMQDLTLKGLSK